jgi:hypothetical protein
MPAANSPDPAHAEKIFAECGLLHSDWGRRALSSLQRSGNSVFPMDLGVGPMSSTRPLQWIEQAEARQVTADAFFRQAPAASRRKLVPAALTEWLPNVSARVLARIVPQGPMLQMQPVLVRRQDRRHQGAPRDDHYC